MKDTNKLIKEKMESVLEEFGYQLTGKRVRISNHVEGTLPREELNKATKSLTQLFNEVAMEVVGEDEYDQKEYEDTENGSEVPFLVRNELRAEQLNKLKSMLGEI
jgi:NAD-specific glutamate dehydrogenase